MLKSRRQHLIATAIMATAVFSGTGFVLQGCSDVQVVPDPTDSAKSYYTDSGSTDTKGAEIGAKTAPASHYTFYQDLPGGGRVLCVTTAESNGSGGVSCDWEHVDSVKR